MEDGRGMAETSKGKENDGGWSEGGGKAMAMKTPARRVRGWEGEGRRRGTKTKDRHRGALAKTSAW